MSSTSTLRNYQSLQNLQNQKVREFYKRLYEKQNYQSTLAKTFEHCQFNHGKMTMSEVLAKVDSFVDPSDPDLDLPNHLHAYATAEMIRERHPENYEYQVLGLIHDLGKILFSFGEESEWIVGDTFVLGCPFPKTMVYYDMLHNHPDRHRPEFQEATTGIYQPRCGLEQLLVSFGHDEYLYQVLKHNRDHHRLSERMMKVIRFHSLYPLHQNNAYTELLSEADQEVVSDLKDFNQYDLYSKSDQKFEITDEMRKYYDTLLQLYFPEPLSW